MSEPVVPRRDFSAVWYSAKGSETKFRVNSVDKFSVNSEFTVRASPNSPPWYPSERIQHLWWGSSPTQFPHSSIASFPFRVMLFVGRSVRCKLCVSLSNQSGQIFFINNIEKVERAALAIMNVSETSLVPVYPFTCSHNCLLSGFWQYSLYCAG